MLEFGLRSIHSIQSAGALAMVLALTGCGGVDDDAPGADGGSDQRPDAGSNVNCENRDTRFNEDAPGIGFVFTISNVELLGNPVGVAAGYFQPAAREDFDRSAPDQIPLDTCRIDGSRTPSCNSNADCAPEQQCLPDTDSDGNPIENSDRCETPRGPLDVGPFTVRGFASGEKVFASNPAQNGGYTTEGDGLLDPTDIVYDRAYEIEGDGDPGQNLGPYRGSLLVPSLVDLSRPVPDSGMFGREIPVDPAVDLQLEWTGATGDGELELKLTGGGNGGSGSGSVTCRVADDGAFSVPAEMVQAAHLGTFSFINILTVSRRTFGDTCGDGLTVAELMSETTIIINMRLAE